MRRRANKFLWVAVIAAAGLFPICACGKGISAKYVNEMCFSLDDISDLSISYDDENISFFTTENEDLVVREYMNKNKKSYYARVSEKKGSIQISEGGKPFFKDDFLRYVEVFLPASYSADLKVTTTDGGIDMEDMELNIDTLRVDTTSGTFKINKAEAKEIYLSSTRGNLELEELIGDQIRIETTQGNVTCKKIEGNVAYTSTSGNAEFLAASGSGTYKANNSGILSVIYDEVTGDLAFFNKNDNIEVSLPEDLAFEFEAVTKNGKITTDFQGDISLKGDSASGTVGDSPTVTVRAETKNGDIEVSR